LYACKEQKEETNEIKILVAENNISSISNDNLNDFIGKYECKNTDTSNESLFLVLKKVNVKSISNFEGYSTEEKNAKGEVVEMTITGILYGNTDLFDDAREGYEPGFFVVNAQIEPLEGNLLKINVNLDSSDILKSPVQPPIESTKEALVKRNNRWEVREMNIAKELIFEIKNSKELILKSDFGSDDKGFKKIK
jgi:hypothetical protein